MLICSIQVILASVYHAAPVVIFIAVLGLLISVVFLFITLYDVSPEIRKPVWLRHRWDIGALRNRPEYRCLFTTYLVALILIFFLALLRFKALVNHSEWRESLQGDFPSACGEWAERCGCTRLTPLTPESDVRIGDLLEQYNTIEFIDRDSINDTIAKCISAQSGAKLQSPDVIQDSEIGELIHVTWVSTMIGFLDDMYIKVEDDQDSKAMINIQS